MMPSAPIPRQTLTTGRLRRDSGLTAAEYAAEVGINLGSLRHWSYVLGREARRQGAPPPAPVLRVKPKVRPSAPPAAPAPDIALPFVELSGSPSRTCERFELELGGGRRLRIPVSFEASALRRLLDVLEAA